MFLPVAVQYCDGSAGTGSPSAPEPEEELQRWTHSSPPSGAEHSGRRVPLSLPPPLESALSFSTELITMTELSELLPLIVLELVLQVKLDCLSVRGDQQSCASSNSLSIGCSTFEEQIVLAVAVSFSIGSIFYPGNNCVGLVLVCLSLPSGTASGGILKILLSTLTSDVRYSGDGMPLVLQSSAKMVDGFFTSRHLL